jgi:hypothetical protein
MIFKLAQALDHPWQLVVPIETTPVLLGSHQA